MTDEVGNIYVDFCNLVKRHLHSLIICDGGKQYTGYVESEEQYNLFFDDLKALGFSFSTENSKIIKNSRILFSFTKNGSDIQIPYFGSPFQILKTSYMLCSQGGNYRPQSLLPTMADNFSTKKRRFSMQPTKKIGCKAFMTVKCIRIFDEDCYKAKSPTYKDGSYENRMIMNRLNKDLLSSSPPAGILRFMILMSSEKEHNHTIVSTNLNQIIHPKVRQEIYQVAKVNRICSVKQMKLHLEKFVKKMFEDKGRPQPDAVNRCYYPTDTALRFHMRQAGFNIKHSKHQQGDLEQCIVIENHSNSGLNNIDYYVEEHDIKFCLPEVKYIIQDSNHEDNALNQCIVIHTNNLEEPSNPVLDIDENKEPNVHLHNLPRECCIIKDSELQKNAVEQCIVIESLKTGGKSNGDMVIGPDREAAKYRINLPHENLVIEETQHQNIALSECIVITANDVEGHLTSGINSSPDVKDQSSSFSEPEICFVIKKRKYQERDMEQCIEITDTESHGYSNCVMNIDHGDYDPNTKLHVLDSDDDFEIEVDENQEEIVEQYIVISAADPEDQTNSDLETVQGEEIELYTTEDEIVSDLNDIQDEVVVTNDWLTEANTDDVQKLLYQTRENLKVIMRYTYEKHTPESVFEIAQLTQQLKNKVLASASNSSSTFPAISTNSISAKSQPVTSKSALQSLKSKYISIPKHTILRTHGKYNN